MEEAVLGLSAITAIFAFLFWATPNEAEPSSGDWFVARAMRLLFLFFALLGSIGIVYFGMIGAQGGQVTTQNLTYANFSSFKNISTQCTNNTNTYGLPWNYLAINNTTIPASALSSFSFDWNGTNTSFYDSSLILAYDFDNVAALGDNATTVVDVSLSRNNATWAQGSSYTTGKYGSAASFNGTNTLSFSAINVSDNSIAFWIFANAWLADGPILFVNSPGDASYAFYNFGGNFYFKTPTGANRNIANPVPPGSWHHVVATTQGTNLSLYYDGAFSGAATLAAAENQILNKFGQQGFNGSLDELRIWNRSLAGSEVAQLYAANLGKVNATAWNFAGNKTGLTNGSYSWNLWANGVLFSSGSQLLGVVTNYTVNCPPEQWEYFSGPELVSTTTASADPSSFNVLNTLLLIFGGILAFVLGITLIGVFYEVFAKLTGKKRFSD